MGRTRNGFAACQMRLDHVLTIFVSSLGNNGLCSFFVAGPVALFLPLLCFRVAGRVGISLGTIFSFPCPCIDREYDREYPVQNEFT